MASAKDIGGKDIRKNEMVNCSNEFLRLGRICTFEVRTTDTHKMMLRAAMVCTIQYITLRTQSLLIQSIKKYWFYCILPIEGRIGMMTMEDGLDDAGKICLSNYVLKF